MKHPHALFAPISDSSGSAETAPKSISDFTGLFAVSETLQFELRPLDADFKPKSPELALANMEKYLEKDRERAGQYSNLKSILDEEHKKLIERVFSEVSASIRQLPASASGRKLLNESGTGILWSKLAEAGGQESSEKVQESFRKLIAELLNTDEKKKSLLEATPSKYIKGMLSSPDLSDSDRKTLSAFEKFACYLKGFQENRANLYSDEAKITAISNRIVNQNFPKFLIGCRIMAHIGEQYPEIIQSAEKNLASILHGLSLKDIFRPDAFDRCLSQSGIDAYNNLLGGFTADGGSQKIQGINETINLYRQQHPDEVKKDKLLAPLPSLFKQILSERSTISYIPEMFDSDHAVCETIRTFVAEADLAKTLQTISDLLSSIAPDDSGVFVAANELNWISNKVFGAWNMIERALDNFAETLKTKKEQDKWPKKKYYSLAELGALDFRALASGDAAVPAVADFWRGQFFRQTAAAVTNAVAEVQSVLNSPDYQPGNRDPLMRENADDVKKIKALFDSLLDLLHFLKPLRVDAPDADQVFYTGFNAVYDRLDTVVPLYNRVRNYLTRKPSEMKKTKLMFDCATLADGWDRNKESSNNAVLLLKDGNYYLAIIQPAKSRTDRKVDFASLETDQQGDCFQKMVYKYLPGPNKMLPKVIFSDRNRDLFAPSAELKRKYDAKLHTKGDNFDLGFCHELIDYFKACIAKHEDWSKFGFKFSDTAKYRGIDEFYNEISAQGYKMSFTSIPASSISDLIRQDKILLFHIYNKDFAPGATGRPNKFTLYWKQLFDEKNLNDVVFKLNGEAELFLRDPSIRKPFRHRKGDKLVNRTQKDGTPIPESVHRELCKLANGQLNESVLSPEARSIWQSGLAVVKTATHDIVKDRRFTVPKFLFHVPITINFKSPDGKYGINQRVNDYLRGNPDVKIIGIDRGERNLIYITLVDQSGRILLQKSFNTIPQKRPDKTIELDYHAKLDLREKERDEARKNWTEINRIRDLKAGYLSQVVHEIARLMVEHNAIVVMEDLNAGFKRGRTAFEKQVYQNFERALITKLNYLVFKDAEESAPGFVRKGLQLANFFDSFEKLGKQSGFLFYVPPSYTSGIDPATGFVSLFQFGKYTNAAARKQFFESFESIRFDAGRNAFAFEFDYSRFPVPKNAEPSEVRRWTVCSVGDRIVHRMKDTQTVWPTGIILSELQKRGVQVSDGFDLLEYIRRTDADNRNASFFSALFDAFRWTVQLRNSDRDNDYILSPVVQPDGTFFDSRKAPDGMPKDADANGAYHIAMKGLYLLRNRFSSAVSKKIDLYITNRDWFDFIQTRSRAN